LEFFLKVREYVIYWHRKIGFEGHSKFNTRRGVYRKDKIFTHLIRLDFDIAIILLRGQILISISIWPFFVAVKQGNCT
jgi:hypothetical protein